MNINRNSLIISKIGGGVNPPALFAERFFF